MKRRLGLKETLHEQQLYRSITNTTMYNKQRVNRQSRVYGVMEMYERLADRCWDTEHSPLIYVEDDLNDNDNILLTSLLPRDCLLHQTEKNNSHNMITNKESEDS
ncbi:unnamed protein product [Danaus chrysippus]|uniref:(African queen) hypothetical protein n=1 Tax=Danaus chrysippus TaxID=151541 RepID=A0A8J2RDS4_9NEOP|nr:unnamed protein product [Danaus chrysippus]